jgi:hypothetical protein
MIAVEEQNIRTNIAARTSPLLLCFRNARQKVALFLAKHQAKMQNYCINSLRRSKEYYRISYHYIGSINGNIIT